MKTVLILGAALSISIAIGGGIWMGLNPSSDFVEVVVRYFVIIHVAEVPFATAIIIACYIWDKRQERKDNKDLSTVL